MLFDLDGPGAEAVAGEVTRRADVDRALDAAAELGRGDRILDAPFPGRRHRR